MPLERPRDLLVKSFQRANTWKSYPPRFLADSHAKGEASPVLPQVLSLAKRGST